MDSSSSAYTNYTVNVELSEAVDPWRDMRSVVFTQRRDYL